LVVEDDPTSRRLLATLLADVGYDVTSAASGEEGMAYLYSEHTCDVVLSDIIMPGMSGVELARRARDARPGLPVILVTGKTDAIELSIKTGSLALCKPVTRDSLSGVLEEALDD
jgi:CheY-like chemotaxis protein